MTGRQKCHRLLALPRRYEDRARVLVMLFERVLGTATYPFHMRSSPF